MDERQIFVGKKPVHLYVRAVVMAMESGDRTVRLTAPGTAIRTAAAAGENPRPGGRNHFGRNNGAANGGAPGRQADGAVTGFHGHAHG
ncbi:MAG: hypothetical protein CBD01_007305, partial [Euryarchaeota archaeon TMED141]